MLVWGRESVVRLSQEAALAEAAAIAVGGKRTVSSTALASPAASNLPHMDRSPFAPLSNQLGMFMRTPLKGHPQSSW
jgi:hypothetical protein